MLRAVFFGTPEFAVPALERLAAAAEVPLVVTQPDRPAGRSAEPQPSPVARAAAARGIPVEKPERIKTNAELSQRLAAARPDVVVVVAYGRLLPNWLLELSRLGAVNVHASLLPRHRGASPVQSAILAGDVETGVSTMRIVEELDAGPVYLEDRTRIGECEDAGVLSRRLSLLGADLLIRTFSGLEAGTIDARPQKGEPTWSPVIRREDAEADWSRPAAELERRLRAFTPWPGLFSFLGAERIKILEAGVGPSGLRGTPGDLRVEFGTPIVVAGGGSSLAVRTLQREGKKPLSAERFVAGLRGPARLGPRRP
ncbi:MAG: methionyl-tRNA formyltransferase [Acidobacteriota bacterium]|nr:methionyl-tRNA formyltransferase [Acidobacteriota bacterium]